MPTIRQRSVHERLAAMFAKTPDWRLHHAGRNFDGMDAAESYVFLAHLFDRLKRWRYRRLPRAVGLPRTEEERLLRREAARREEAVARLAVPDDERETWQVDRRPPAVGSAIPYMELNRELEEALAIDHPGLFADRDRSRR